MVMLVAVAPQLLANINFYKHTTERYHQKGNQHIHV